MCERTQPAGVLLVRMASPVVIVRDIGRGRALWRSAQNGTELHNSALDFPRMNYNVVLEVIVC